jgi:hypothetical protein
MKKLIALVLALALVMAVAVASAATISVQHIVNGQTYTAYKLLNYTNSDTAFAYYLIDGSCTFSFTDITGKKKGDISPIFAVLREKVIEFLKKEVWK